MQKCAKCLIDKRKKEFYRKNGKRLQSYCKQCLLNYQMARWHKRKLEAIAYKGGKCSRCGYNQHWAALCFHHLRDKELNWNKARQVSRERMFKELDKCELLCANCHMEHHAGELRT